MPIRLKHRRRRSSGRDIVIFVTLFVFVSLTAVLYRMLLPYMGSAAKALVSAFTLALFMYTSIYTLRRLRDKGAIIGPLVAAVLSAILSYTILTSINLELDAMGKTTVNTIIATLIWILFKNTISRWIDDHID